MNCKHIYRSPWSPMMSENRRGNRRPKNRTAIGANVTFTVLGAGTFLGGADGVVGLTVFTATEKNDSRIVTKTLVAYIMTKLT